MHPQKNATHCQYSGLIKVHSAIFLGFVLFCFPTPHGDCPSSATGTCFISVLHLLVTFTFSLPSVFLSCQYCKSCCCVSGQCHQWNPGLLFALFVLYKIIVIQLLCGRRFCKFRSIVQPFCVSQNHSSKTNLYLIKRLFFPVLN